MDHPPSRTASANSPSSWRNRSGPPDGMRHPPLSSGSSGSPRLRGATTVVGRTFRSAWQAPGFRTAPCRRARPRSDVASREPAPRRRVCGNASGRKAVLRRGTHACGARSHLARDATLPRPAVASVCPPLSVRYAEVLADDAWRPCRTNAGAALLLRFWLKKSLGTDARLRARRTKSR